MSPLPSFLGLPRLAPALAALLLALPAPASLRAAPGPASAPQEAPGCERCHGELELLRQQHGETLVEARQLLVRISDLEGTAHDGMTCVDCHEGFGRFPHPEEATATEGCADCHEAADSAWRTSIHAEGSEEPRAACGSCHGLHAVSQAPTTLEARGGEEMADRCVDCHQTAGLPADDPHAGEVGCWACHDPHATRLIDAAESRVWRTAQVETCGGCHDSIADVWRTDAHGRALAEPAGPAGRSEPAPPACTDCHGGHGMVGPTDSLALDTLTVARCGSCHAYYERTYRGTYHGAATAVGSRVVATCHDCHSAHEVLPASNPRSTISEERLPGTCGACHGHVRPSFVAYESHPDPTDRSKNPVLFYSFWFMNILLVSVLGIFGLHTLLWWVRLEIDRRRGIRHEIGGEHE